jgi:hypothetical protein
MHVKMVDGPEFDIGPGTVFSPPADDSDIHRARLAHAL